MLAPIPMTADSTQHNGLAEHTHTLCTLLPDYCLTMTSTYIITMLHAQLPLQCIPSVKPSHMPAYPSASCKLSRWPPCKLSRWPPCRRRLHHYPGRTGSSCALNAHAHASTCTCQGRPPALSRLCQLGVCLGQKVSSQSYCQFLSMAHDV